MFGHFTGKCFCGASSDGGALCAMCSPKAKGVGRILLALIFVVGGYGFVTGFSGQADMLGNKDYVIGIFDMLPGMLMALVGVVLKVGGAVGLLLGYQTRYAALALVLYVALATLMFHVGDGQLTAALKNLAVIGGLLYVLSAGPGAWALDARKSA